MAQPADDRSDRVEREIDEILRRSRFGDGAPRQPARRSRGGPDLSRFKPRSPGQLLLIGALLVLIEYVGLARFLGGWIGLIGFGLLVIGGVTYFMRPSGGRRYWRGEAIELPDDRRWAARLYRWIYRA